MSRPLHVPSRRPSSAVPGNRTSGNWSGRPLRSRPDSAQLDRSGLQEIVIDYADPACVIGHIQNLTFSAWNTAPTVEHVEAFIALAKKLCETYPHNSNVTLVMPEAELPGAEARVALERLTAQYAQRIHSVALVIDGSGFWASMIRSFLTGLHLLRGNGYRCKAFANPGEAGAWLLPAHTDDTHVMVTPRELDVACQAVYQRMREAAAAR